MRYKCLYIIFILLTIVLVSCNTQDNLQDQENGYPMSDALSEEPISLFDLDEGYPVEESFSEQDDFYASEINIPLPQNGLAVVHGTLWNLNEDLPYLAPSLYLGHVFKPDEPESTLIISSVSIEEDPIALQAVNGDFVFIDVPPGEYGLFIWTPMSLFQIVDGKTDLPIFLEVEAGEIKNLGVIYIP